MINPGSRNQDNVNNNFNDIIPHVINSYFLIKVNGGRNVQINELLDIISKNAN